METPRTRMYVRPGSSDSIVSGRSSFESRAKSPLSISSSLVSHDTSRTSVDSYVSNRMLSLGENEPVPAYAHDTGYFESITKRDSMPRSMVHSVSDKKSKGILKTPPRASLPPRASIMRVGGDFTGISYTGRIPGEGFKKLPEEILLVILAELRKSHLENGSLSCATCWMRDCCNLGLASKKWWRAARIMLYENIQLIGNDSVFHTKKAFKVKFGTRLKLLRRNLRSRPQLAALVKSLKVPLIPDTTKTKKEQDEYVDLVASLVMACPNLERLPGYYPAYKHEFTRLTQALQSRPRLLEHVWIIESSSFQRQRRYTMSEEPQRFMHALTPGPLQPEQSIEFMNYHSNWDYLETMFFHCKSGGMIGAPLFTKILAALPSLQNLYVSSFPASSFNNDTLLSLPPLKSLRLESLPGITADGLSAYASMASSRTLKNLSLISLPLLSLPVLARLLSRLVSLASLTISQGPTLNLPDGEEIFMYPYLACPTLKFLHWEIMNPVTNSASEILAKSIQFNGFPSLKTLRAPTDYDGSLQALCKPREKIELSGDRYRHAHMQPIPSSQSMPDIPSPTSTRSTFFGGSNSSQTSIVAVPSSPAYGRSSPIKSLSSFRSSRDGELSKREGQSLAQARRQAQARIDAAEKQPKFHIIVWNEQGEFVERSAVAGYIGNAASKISYSLEPDVAGMDESIAGIDDLLDGGDEVNMRDGCTGSWNLEVANAGSPGKGKSPGKDRDRWWHTERGRWREIGLEKFF
ncbi:hypothetical protein PVAG01_01358 [Phlyctema vagabunda]|uniref:F-box domain-containing protein n=1 Tax=Phlyctema vagabunda TaxID=108571 RepID=A0ABR4PWW3_9HELO